MGAFPVGAGVVARGAGRLTMVGPGARPRAVSVPEVGHVELGREVYPQALAAIARRPRRHRRVAVALRRGRGPRGTQGVAVCEVILRGA